ncbi:MAG: hypothetical protein D6785_08065, partial [Planctomycetota bacterium]
KEAGKYPFFFLFSGFSKLISIPDKYKKIEEEEKRVILTYLMARTAYRIPIYIKKKEWMAAYFSLIRLKSSFSNTSLFKKHHIKLKKYFAFVLPHYFEQEGLKAFYWSDMTEKEDGTISLTYQPTYIRGWRDWKLVRTPFQPKPKGRFTQKGMILNGKIQIPFVFQNNLEITIYFRSLNYRGFGLELFGEGSRESLFMGPDFAFPQHSPYLEGFPKRSLGIHKTWICRCKISSTKAKVKVLRKMSLPSLFEGKEAVMKVKVSLRGIEIKLPGRKRRIFLSREELGIEFLGKIALWELEKDVYVQKILIHGKLNKTWRKILMQKIMKLQIERF